MKVDVLLVEERQDKLLRQTQDAGLRSYPVKVIRLASRSALTVGQTIDR